VVRNALVVYVVRNIEGIPKEKVQSYLEWVVGFCTADKGAALG